MAAPTVKFDKAQASGLASSESKLPEGRLGEDLRRIDRDQRASMKMMAADQRLFRDSLLVENQKRKTSVAKAEPKDGVSTAENEVRKSIATQSRLRRSVQLHHVDSHTLAEMTNRRFSRASVLVPPGAPDQSHQQRSGSVTAAVSTASPATSDGRKPNTKKETGKVKDRTLGTATAETETNVFTDRQLYSQNLAYVQSLLQSCRDELPKQVDRLTRRMRGNPNHIGNQSDRRCELRRPTVSKDVE